MIDMWPLSFDSPWNIFLVIFVGYVVAVLIAIGILSCLIAYHDWETRKIIKKIEGKVPILYKLTEEKLKEPYLQENMK